MKEQDTDILALFAGQQIPFPSPSEAKFTFIDLFAGIGGFRLALQSLGGKCVFSSEWNKDAAKTYETNFGEYPHGDITLPQTKALIPKDFDILCAGFPCQAFSIAGLRKGFADTRGTLFFDIEEIVDKHRPKVIFLENVKNLISHDGGRTLSIIKQQLSELGYHVHHSVLNSSAYGVPQNRERIYFVALRQDLTKTDFSFPSPSSERISIQDILEHNPTDAKVITRPDIQMRDKEWIEDKFNILGNKPNRPIQIGFLGKGGQGERIYDPRGHAITLSAYGGGVGSKTGLYLIEGQVRKLSPRECARVQGFPDNYILAKPTLAYTQLGNSVSVPVLRAIAQSFIPLLYD